MPYWNFEYTKAVIYTVVKVGGGIGKDPATEVTHLRLNQPPVFSSVPISTPTIGYCMQGGGGGYFQISNILSILSNSSVIYLTHTFHSCITLFVKDQLA